MAAGSPVTHDLEVRGPWSLTTSRRFWEGFAPQRLPSQEGPLTTVFRADREWEPLRAQVTQDGPIARISVGRTDGKDPRDPEAAIAQVARFLSLDVDAASWPTIGEHLRGLDPDDAFAEVQGILGLGLFAAELVVIRGANAPDALPRNEQRLAREITERYGDGADLATVSSTWRPLRSWAAVLLRIGREERTGEIEGRRPGRK